MDQAKCVRDIYSVSACVSRDFADYINYWKHNGYWFFDTPKILSELADRNSIDLTGTHLFFYEVYERQFDAELRQWVEFEPGRSFRTQVYLPSVRILEGYAVVTFFARTSAECSPLSCNSLASEVETNGHCLLPSLETATKLLEEGKFENTEPGPYRIFAVYSMEWPEQRSVTDPSTIADPCLVGFLTASNEGRQGDAEPPVPPQRQQPASPPVAAR